MVAGNGILAVVIVLFVLPPARPLEDSICDAGSSSSSSFEANLNLLAAALPSNASSAPAGFATLSAGPAYAMALCRGDANASSCAACVAVAFRAAGERCLNTTGVTMYEDDCVLRFANRQFLDFLKAEQWQVGELRYREFHSSIFLVLDRVGSSSGHKSTMSSFEFGLQVEP
uniref:Gnk2-homologous domain-containing protein n=1 Tax=Aegilops tauschii subsp. strangulata TaxID=200361 RepID=A0A453T8L2_AEGTS